MPIYFRPFPDELPFYLRSIGNHWEQEAVDRRKGLPYYYWLQTEHGCGTIHIGSLERKLNIGEGVLIGPEVPHACYGDDKTWRTSFAAFGGFLEKDIGKIIGDTPYQFTDAKNAAYFSGWVNHMILGFTELEMTSDEASAACYSFFLHFSPVYQTKQLQQHPLYIQYIVPVIREIETRYYESLTLEALASFVFISPQYLSRLFQRFTGSTFHKYLTRFRINKAKELMISQPHLDIQYISGQVGYNDTSHFIAVFKRLTGYTPFEYRRIYKS